MLRLRPSQARARAASHRLAHASEPATAHNRPQPPITAGTSAESSMSDEWTRGPVGRMPVD